MVFGNARLCPDDKAPCLSLAALSTSLPSFETQPGRAQSRVALPCHGGHFGWHLASLTLILLATYLCAKPVPNLPRPNGKIGFWQTGLRLFFKVPRPQTTTRLNSPAIVFPATSLPKTNLTLPLPPAPRPSTHLCFRHPLPNDGVSGTALPSNHHGRRRYFARPTTTASPRRSRVRCTRG